MQKTWNAINLNMVQNTRISYIKTCVADYNIQINQLQTINISYYNYYMNQNPSNGTRITNHVIYRTRSNSLLQFTTINTIVWLQNQNPCI